MSESSNTLLSYSTEKIKSLNEYFIQAGIKHIAMDFGVWAKIKKVENGIVELSYIKPKDEAEKAPFFVKILEILIHVKDPDWDLREGIAEVRVFEYLAEGRAGYRRLHTDNPKVYAEQKKNMKMFKESRIIPVAVHYVTAQQLQNLYKNKFQGKDGPFILSY